MLDLPSYVAGTPVTSDDKLEVFYPYDGSLTGKASKIDKQQLDQAIESAIAGHQNSLSRHERHSILRKVAGLVRNQSKELATLICRETGLCIRDTEIEVTRTADVFEFAAMEALKDDGEVFSCDVTPQGKHRKIVTFKQPVQLISAITPFNFPLNQVAHKVAPAIAAGAPIILKPSEKAPLVAIRVAELLYEAGLPGWMLSVVCGDLDTVVTPMITDDRVEMVSFTGSVSIGKEIAATTGYKKTCLELGGNSPLIILEDADLDKAVELAAEGAFRNSGQRCTAVKRILVQESILETFTEKFVEKAKLYICGDPEDPATWVGTVIDQTAAQKLQNVVDSAVQDGAQILLGGKSEGVFMPPTVLGNVSRDSQIVKEESFGPLAPIISIKDLDDAIDYYNSGNFGLSSGIVTNDLNLALKAAKHLKTGTTNINEVPGFRTEISPFGGIKDSGLGIKEGVVEAMRYMQNTKTFSFPWE